MLGPAEENVYRFQSFQPPDEFAAALEEGLRRWRLFRAGDEAWAAPPERTEVLTEAGSYEAIAAPSDEVPSGVASVGGVLWVAHGDVAYSRDAPGGGWRERFALPRMSQDLAARDGELWVVGSGWTAGEPIVVLDPASGQRLREVRTAANEGQRAHSSRGIAFAADRLFVLEIGGRLHELDPATGDVRRTTEIGQSWVYGLAFDGTRLYAPSRAGVVVIDPASGRMTGTLPTGYPLRSIGHHDGRLVLLEQPVFGFDRAHRSVRVFPRETKVWLLRPDRR